MKKTLEKLGEIVSGKKIYVWGAMIVGQGVCRALERYGLKVTGFLDSSPSFQGKTALGYPIYLAGEILRLEDPESSVILISSGHYDLEIEETCTEAGLVKDRHYIMSRELNDLDPSVDISGICNLKCISCPRGNMKVQPAPGQMSVEDYQRVLDKLLREIPFLGNIQFYAWGEPLLNKNLPEIIERTREAKVLTAISSNLNVAGNYAQIIQAGLDWFKVSASGFGKSYEITHTGGRWNKFLKNLYYLAELKAKYQSEMQIILNYHLYKHNLGEDYENMKALCEELDLIFRPSPAYLYPMDTLRDYLDGKPLSNEAERTMSMLMMGLDEGIAKALRRKDKPCPEERCLPISWDRRVRFCGVYFKPHISDDFLKTPLDEILKKRSGSRFCRECMARGLHQFTSVYLREKIISQGADGSL